MATTLSGDVTVTGTLRVAGGSGNMPKRDRADLSQETLVAYPLDLLNARVHDDIRAMVPAAGAADDLGLYGNTFATDSPTLETGDLKAAGDTNRYARFQFILPPEYDDGETVKIRVHCGMETTVSDTTGAVDIVCYKSDKEGGIGSDLCTTTETSCNILAFADKDFAITSTGFATGDILDFRLDAHVNDAATGTAVILTIGSVEVLLDVRG